MELNSEKMSPDNRLRGDLQMKIIHNSLKAAAAMSVGMGMCGVAGAQDMETTLPVTLSYAPTLNAAPAKAPSYMQSRRDTWNTVLLVSAIVLAVGIIQSESTLVILGGAGVIVSLVQMDRRFQLQYTPRGINLFQSGPLTFGLNPLSQPGLVDKPGPARLGYYAALNFKF
jgi:hypothetical protein